MKTRQVTIHEGELLGPIDWAFDFAEMGWSENKGGINPQIIDSRVDMLRQIEQGEWDATTDGGMPRCGWGKVLATGMYDGWPHWRPVPSFLLSSHMGASWHPWYSLTDIKRADLVKK
jgi:hypothetical protein